MQNKAPATEFFFLSQETINERLTGYEDEKLPLLTSALGKPDTKSIWYSREHIAMLLAEIDNVNGNGLRIHFGRYEKGHQYEGQLCLIMKPTRPGNSGSHKKPAQKTETGFDGSFTEEGLYFEDDGDGLKGFNYGSPCPPFCD